MIPLALAASAGPSEWPQFRGPRGAGVADEASLPERWSTTQNVAWAVEIPGRGWSSPIVWRDRVFVTAAISPGAFKAPSTGIFGNDYAAELMKQGLPVEEVNKRVINRDIELTAETGDIRYMVYALDARTGTVLWEREAHKGQPFGGRHRKNTYASETPVTDGERLYVSFGGNVGLFVYRSTARSCGSTRGRRNRSISISERRRLQSSTRDASISCTTTTAKRSLRHSTQRRGQRCGA